MKHIAKNPEPPAFCNWKAHWPNFVPGWMEFDSGTKHEDGTSIKHKVKTALLHEQGGLCCFCEDRVDMNHGHIAHILDRKNHSDKALEYDNMLYSCPENLRNKPQTCGHAQGTQILPISPLDTNCEQKFAYTSTGSIIPRNADDHKAFDTIRILNLDDKNSLLPKKRAMIFQTVEDERQKYSSTEFKIWIDRELERQSDGMFKTFWTVKKYAAGLYE